MRESNRSNARQIPGFRIPCRSSVRYNSQSQFFAMLPMTNELPQSLIGALQNQRIIPFAGAGVSMAVKRRGASLPTDPPAFPNWSGLLLDAATQVEKEGKDREAAYIRACIGMAPPKMSDAAEAARTAL